MKVSVDDCARCKASMNASQVHDQSMAFVINGNGVIAEELIQLATGDAEGGLDSELKIRKHE